MEKKPLLTEHAAQKALLDIQKSILYTIHVVQAPATVQG